jgi:hypothetical protein
MTATVTASDVQWVGLGFNNNLAMAGADFAFSYFDQNDVFQVGARERAP